MKHKSLLVLLISLQIIPVISSAASHSFFEKGSCYIFVPRHDFASKGEVVMVTPQEVVFKNVKVIVSTGEEDSSSDSLKAIMKKDKLLDEYVKSKDRSKYEAPVPYGNSETRFSYSRSEMTASKLDRCSK